MMSDDALRIAGQRVLDRLPHSLIVVDDRARPFVMNAAGRDALAGGLRLDGQAVREAVTAATGPTASWLSSASVLTLSLGTGAVQGLILPALIDIDPLLGKRGLAFVAFGRDGRTPPRELLAAMYGLTRRECDLALGLLEGQSIAEAARSLEMTLPTARTHLGHLLEKTGTTRQSALLRVLLGSAP